MVHTVDQALIDEEEIAPWSRITSLTPSNLILSSNKGFFRLPCRLRAEAEDLDY